MATFKAEQSTAHCRHLARVSWTPPTRRSPQGGSSLPVPLTQSREGDLVWLDTDG